jgi:hypothetical protein
VRGENLTSGNTKGCGCNKGKKISSSRHDSHKNEYYYDSELNCWVGYANNTDAKFLIDDIDYEVVSKYCWYETKEGRLMTRLSKNEQIFLHRLLMFGLSAKHTEAIVDHINRDPHDNRRCNLRQCSYKENSYNASVSSNNASNILGVSWYKPGNKWRVYICPDGKFISLGYYDTLEEAAKVRKEAERKYWGEFAPQ